MLSIFNWVVRTGAAQAGDFVADKFSQIMATIVLDLISGAIELAGTVYALAFDSSELQITTIAGGLFYDARTVAGGLSGLALMIGMLWAIFSGNPNVVAKRLFLDAPKFVLTSAFMLTGVTTLVGITNEVNDRLVQAITNNPNADSVADLFSQLAAVTEVLKDADPAASGLSSMLLVLIAILLFISAFFTWLVLNVRSAVVYLLIVLSPLVALGMMTNRKDAIIKLLELVFALVVSKTVMILAMALGAAAVGAALGGFSADAAALEALAAAPLGPDAPGAAVSLQSTGVGSMVSALFAAMLVLLMATFSPWLVMQLLPGLDGGGSAMAQGTAGAGRFGHRARNRMRRK